MIHDLSSRYLHLSIHTFVSDAGSMTKSRKSGGDSHGTRSSGGGRSPVGRGHKRLKKSKPNPHMRTELLHLSSDVLADEIITRLGASELCALSCCSSMFHALTVRLLVQSGPQCVHASRRAMCLIMQAVQSAGSVKRASSGRRMRCPCT